MTDSPFTAVHRIKRTLRRSARLTVPRQVTLIAFAIYFSVVCTSGSAQIAYEKPPISYGAYQPQDAVAKLIESIEAGDAKLEYDSKWGWLPSLLKHLNVSPKSQTLVFSKTSLQLHKISPRTPRALYFNDEVYLGWCRGGDLVEIAATDPNNGAIFYSVSQSPAKPEIRRDRGQCLTCHATHRTQGVPGFLIRSIYPDNNGRPRSGTRTYATDHTTEFDKRFGGWFVTGKHGDIRHMGNTIARDRSEPEHLDRESGANLLSLEERFDTSHYLRGDSDIVALMLLEHQSQMHNYIARASIETRVARYYDRGINEALERPLETLSPSTVRRIDSAADKLVRYMLLADEVPLPNPVQGGGDFEEYFSSDENSAIRRDDKGRSLHDLDLQTRLLKYPCSYLIYSTAFEALPKKMAEAVQKRLSAILLSEKPPAGYDHLSQADRTAIAEILADTKPGYLVDTATADSADAEL
ncbi:MAG: hypothetical protein Aurels2KO_07520 [Aureliella sp.]